MRKILINSLTLSVLLSAGNAMALVIDGDLSDWGIHRTGRSSDWTPNSSVPAFSIEDQHSSYLSPGFGGQAYDAEAMYVSWDTSMMYIAIATGHSPLTPDNPSANSYGAGDIAIDFGRNGSWDYGIEMLGSRSTAKGHVYSDVNWGLGLWKSNGAWTGYYNPSDPRSLALADTANPTSILSGKDRGIGEVAYTTSGQNNIGAWINDLHYFYEVAVPLSAFGSNWVTGNTFDLHWSQNCANDSILVDPKVAITVPEPGTLALLPLGILGLLAIRRKEISR